MREIAELFDSTTSESSEGFLRHFGSIVKPDELAKRLGVWRHPLYQEAVREGLRAKAKRQVLSVTMYCLDPSAQHKLDGKP